MRGEARKMGIIQKTIDRYVIEPVLKRIGDKSRTAFLVEDTLNNLFHGEANNMRPELTPYFFYKRDPFVMACLNAVSEGVAHIPCYIARVDDPENPLESVDDDLARWMIEPNSNQSLMEFISDGITKLELWGKCFIEPYYDAEAGQYKTVNVKPSRMTVDKVYNDYKIYRYRINGKETLLTTGKDIEELIYEDPDSDRESFSPLQAAILDMQTGFAARVFNNAFLENGCSPQYAASFKHGISADELVTFEKWFMQKFTGPKNANKILMFNNEVSFDKLGLGPQEIQYLDLLKWVRGTIMSVLEVPPFRVGVMEYANYANSREQTKAFWIYSIIPRAKRYEGLMTRVVRLMTGDESLLFRFDFAAVPELQLEERERVDIALSELREGVITINETRQQIGLSGDDLDGGDVPLVAMGRVPLTEAAAKIEIPADVKSDTMPELKPNASN